MTILITGAAGFVGSKMVEYLCDSDKSITLIGIDNLSRKGSEYNVGKLAKFNCKFIKGDIGIQKDIYAIPKVDWIIDCAANPSVLAGLNNDSLQLINDNLTGTFYLLEKCKRDGAGLIMLSTSRVYSIEALNKIKLVENENHFSINKNVNHQQGLSSKGIAESFSTTAPISLYGATKLASEILALEYHNSFGFPVWINRCGVIAGAGQFGKIDQGIFSFWVYQYLLNKPLSFIGFGGSGKQVRDMVHPYDVFQLIQKQIAKPNRKIHRTVNIGGGVDNALSLAQLDSFCKEDIDADKQINKIAENRSFDIPLYITDYSLANKLWQWQPSYTVDKILKEILSYAEDNIEHIKQIS